MSLLQPNENVKEDKKTKEERIRDLVKSIRLIEESVTPFKEQLKDLKNNYVQNGWISKDELHLILKSLSILKEDIDLDKLTDMIKKIKF